MDHCPVVSGRTKGFTGCDLADFGALPTDLLALQLLFPPLIANKASQIVEIRLERATREVTFASH